MKNKWSNFVASLLGGSTFEFKKTTITVDGSKPSFGKSTISTDDLTPEERKEFDALMADVGKGVEVPDAGKILEQIMDKTLGQMERNMKKFEEFASKIEARKKKETEAKK